MAVKLAVLMSCYNGEAYLAKAMDSILAQSHADFKFVIVNDGSSDGTGRILDEYSRMDRRITVIHKSNSGLADSLNTGLRVCDAEWIARLDADDLAMPARLEKQLNLAEAENAVFVGSNAYEVDEHGEVIAEYTYPSNHDLMMANLLGAKAFPAHSSAFIRYDALRRIGFYRPRIRRSQDWDLWLRLSTVGRLAAVPEPLVMIRKHAEQISHDAGGRRQILFSRASMVGYHLRSMGRSDPIDADESLFDQYMAWMDRRLKQEGIYDFHTFRKFGRMCIREPATLAKQSLNKMPLFNPLGVLNYWVRQGNDDKLVRKLAAEWVDEVCVD